MFVTVMSGRGVADVTVDLVQEGRIDRGRPTVTTGHRLPCEKLGGGGRAEDVVQALAEGVPRLGIELGPVGEDQVLKAGYSRPGKLLIVLLDAPLQLGSMASSPTDQLLPLSLDHCLHKSCVTQDMVVESKCWSDCRRRVPSVRMLSPSL